MPGSETNVRVVAVVNLKGGVGKTTTVLNLAGFAGRNGKRVLAIDTDPQGSLSEAFAQRARSLDGVRVPSRFPNVDRVPATLALEAVLQSAIPWEGCEYVLLDMLTPHLAEYDLVLIDCRPGVARSVTNALTADLQLALAGSALDDSCLCCGEHREATISARAKQLNTVPAQARRKPAVGNAR
jgi:cellulose biosynthesis protein BcsQ